MSELSRPRTTPYAQIIGEVGEIISRRPAAEQAQVARLVARAAALEVRTRCGKNAVALLLLRLRDEIGG